MRSRRRIIAPRLRSTPMLADYSRDLRPAKWGPTVNLHSNNSEPLMSALCQKRTFGVGSNARCLRSAWQAADIQAVIEYNWVGLGGAQLVEHRHETCSQTISTTSDRCRHVVSGAAHRESADLSDAVDHDNCSVCPRRSN